MTPQHFDKHTLATRQYRDASNLNARAALHARFGSNAYPWFRWVFDQALSVAGPEAHVLEVGAGPAGLWRENLDRLPAAWRVTLTDLSEGMVAEERAALAASGAAFAFTVADIEALPYPDGAFDLVIANHMLYHVPDRSTALREVRRVLRPGGYLVAATNGAQTMGELTALVRGAAPEAAETRLAALASAPFTLENGAAQLAPYFDSIETRQYDDSLEVTEVEPLVAYVRSIDTPECDEPSFVAAVADHAREVMARNGGVFHITKSVGIFLARRAEEPCS